MNKFTNFNKYDYRNNTISANLNSNPSFFNHNIQTPTYQNFAHLTPIHQTPIHQTSVHQTPIHQTSVHQTPVQHNFMYQSPIQHNSAYQTSERQYSMYPDSVHPDFIYPIPTRQNYINSRDSPELNNRGHFLQNYINSSDSPEFNKEHHMQNSNEMPNNSFTDDNSFDLYSKFPLRNLPINILTNNVGSVEPRLSISQTQTAHMPQKMHISHSKLQPFNSCANDFVEQSTKVHCKKTKKNHYNKQRNYNKHNKYAYTQNKQHDIKQKNNIVEKSNTTKCDNNFEINFDISVFKAVVKKLLLDFVEKKLDGLFETIEQNLKKFLNSPRLQELFEETQKSKPNIVFPTVPSDHSNKSSSSNYSKKTKSKNNFNTEKINLSNELKLKNKLNERTSKKENYENLTKNITEDVQPYNLRPFDEPCSLKDFSKILIDGSTLANNTVLPDKRDNVKIIEDKLRSYSQNYNWTNSAMDNTFQGLQGLQGFQNVLNMSNFTNSPNIQHEANNANEIHNINKPYDINEIGITNGMGNLENVNPEEFLKTHIHEKNTEDVRESLDSLLESNFLNKKMQYTTEEIELLNKKFKNNENKNLGNFNDSGDSGDSDDSVDSDDLEILDQIKNNLNNTVKTNDQVIKKTDNEKNNNHLGSLMTMFGVNCDDSSLDLKNFIYGEILNNLSNKIDESGIEKTIHSLNSLINNKINTNYHDLSSSESSEEESETDNEDNEDN